MWWHSTGGVLNQQCTVAVQLFEAVLDTLWSSSGAPPRKMKAMELVFSDAKGAFGTPLVEIPPPPSSPTRPHLSAVGMVGWKFRIVTPEAPCGRSLFVVANDVTHGAGAFGPREDAFFEAITNLALSEKLPLVYLAANSGARIGLAEEIRSCFRVGWTSDPSPEKGFQYLYLTPQDFARLRDSVKAHRVSVPSPSGVAEVRYVLSDVIGAEDGLGVECLSGSAAIASAFSRAYAELPLTLTFVSGRTVGIGAYLARLGVRCIQRVDRPIILTGYAALNKLLGREVYSSHMQVIHPPHPLYSPHPSPLLTPSPIPCPLQLGGPKVMATNGVVHETVSDDLAGVAAILRWLSYVPPVTGCPPPILPTQDPIERPMGYVPDSACHPRAAIGGQTGPDGGFQPGLFDSGSFHESYPQWAQTVVTGRARLGGCAVGVIAVEVNMVMAVIPADPGQPDSHERVQPQAGQVWFPDSATKTAQAIADFDREGLPLLILANWRGFSAGQQDLFNGILQAGSKIVEALRIFRPPAFVYIPKGGELRGGRGWWWTPKLIPTRSRCTPTKARAGACWRRRAWWRSSSARGSSSAPCTDSTRNSSPSPARCSRAGGRRGPRWGPQ